jgi:hypothetical protein
LPEGSADSILVSVDRCAIEVSITYRDRVSYGLRNRIVRNPVRTKGPQANRGHLRTGTQGACRNQGWVDRLHGLIGGPGKRLHFINQETFVSDN